jgi:tRNA (mo5U34)-methyltransferase
LEVKRQLKLLGKWFHNIELCGIQTAPDHFLGDFPATKWRSFESAIPQNMAGQTVLDIGCNGGFYSLEMKKRGAARVLGIDHDPNYLAQARFAAKVFDLDIEFREMSVYNVGDLRERFDLVLFMGVLYHLRHPLLALDLIHEKVARGLFLFQSMLRGSHTLTGTAADYPFDETKLFAQESTPRMYFIEHSFAGDPTNWWIPNRSCVEAMLRSAGFRIIGQPEEEVYLCHATESYPGNKQ